MSHYVSKSPWWHSQNRTLRYLEPGTIDKTRMWISAMVLWVREQLDSGMVVNNIGTFFSPFWHVICSSKTDACLCLHILVRCWYVVLICMTLHYPSVRDWCLSEPAPPTWCSDDQILHILDARLLGVWEGLPVPSPPSHVLCWYSVWDGTYGMELLSF